MSRRYWPAYVAAYVAWLLLLVLGLWILVVSREAYMSLAARYAGSASETRSLCSWPGWRGWLSWC
jgi:hypothetical protein